MRLALVVLMSVPACWTGEAPAHTSAIEPPAASALARRGFPRAQPRQQLAWPDRVRTELMDFVSAPIVRLDLTQATVTTLCGDPAFEAAVEWQGQLASAKTAPTCQVIVGPQWVTYCFVDSPGWLQIFFKDEDAPYLAAAIVGTRKGATHGLMSQWQQQVASPVCP